MLSECSALNPDPEGKLLSTKLSPDDLFIGDSDSEAELGGFSEEQRQDLEEVSFLINPLLSNNDTQLLGDDPERFQDPSEEEDNNNEQNRT